MNGIAELENGSDALMPPTANGEPKFAEAAQPLDEDRSSSLSDLEDAADEVELVSAPPALSRQIEAESEAETERLENSPIKGQIQKHSETHAAAYTQSPNKLAQSEIIQVVEQETFSDSVVSSPGPSEDDLESEIRSEHSAASDKLDTHVRNGSYKKRKHQDIEDDTTGEDAGEARRHRKRAQSVRSDAEQSELGLSREATIEPIGEIRDHQGVLEGTSNMPRSAQNITKSRSTRAAKGKHGKGKSRETLKNIAEEREDSDKVAELGADEARIETDDEEHAEGEDEDVEAAARDDEECKVPKLQPSKLADAQQTRRRWQPWTPWPPWRSTSLLCEIGSCAPVAQKLACLTHSSLYDERTAALNYEIAQLSAPKPSHPEFLRQLDCIRKYRDEKFDTEQKLLVYKIKSLKTESVAHRSQIHSAYFQTVRDVREKHLDRIGERLSRVRRDHVKTDEKIPSYSIPFPSRRSIQITQQSSYNKEVSILSGVAKYVGFPAAPDVNSALQNELDEDLERMGVSLYYAPLWPLASAKGSQASLNQFRNLKPAQPKLPRNAFSSVLSRPAAEEQFLEQNPWANPQHPIHLQHIGRLSRRISDQTQVADTTVTPATQKSLADPNRPAGSASTILDHLSAQASSTLATPLSTNDGFRHRASEITTADGDQQLPSGYEKPQQQKERLQSLSPTETRKHSSAANDAGPKVSNSKGGAALSVEEVSSAMYKPSRIALFGSTSRPESLPRHSPPNAEIGGRHATPSPITLHQHTRENNLTAATGLSRIGAR